MERELLDYVKNNIITIDDYNILTSKINICNFDSIKKIIDKLKTTTIHEQILNKYPFVSDDIKNTIIENNDIKYNSQQKRAIKKLVKFLFSDNKIFGLYGYAGTGKTTLIINFIIKLLDNKLLDSVLIVAPTHKALNVLKNKLANNLDYFKNKYNIQHELNFVNTLNKLKSHKISIEFSTIHRLLKYKTDFNLEGELIFTKGSSNNLLSNYDLIIIDECSMIPITILYDIFSQSELSKTKIIFLGDPAQLPPVNEKDSLIFNENKLNIDNFKKYFNFPITEDKYDKFYTALDGIATYRLKKIMRTNHNSIMIISKLIRNWIKQSEFPDLSTHVDKLTVNIYGFEIKSKLKTKWFKKFVKVLKKEKDSIIITWTNNQMIEYNNYIRQILFNKHDIAQFEIGDILIINQSYNIINNRLFTSEKIEILEIKNEVLILENIKSEVASEVKNYKHYRAIQGRYENQIKKINDLHKVGYKVWKLKVKRIYTNVSHDIYIIEESEQNKYQYNLQQSIDLIKNLRQNLITDHAKAISIDNIVIQPLWREHYTKFVEPFADVNYGYAITCHKAQGSNYKNVFVDFNDILKNQNELEMKKCLYTAVTRTIDGLYILI
jgi:hypothetical protein